MHFRRYPCGGWFAPGTHPKFERTDQGEDRSVKRGIYVRAPGRGYVVAHLNDAPFPDGFGSPYAVVKIESGRFAIGDGLWYVGHANEDVLPVGTRFEFQDRIARANNGFYPSQGWVENGKCVNGLPGPTGTGARYHHLFRPVWKLERRRRKHR